MRRRRKEQPRKNASGTGTATAIQTTLTTIISPVTTSDNNAPAAAARPLPAGGGAPTGAAGGPTGTAGGATGGLAEAAPGQKGRGRRVCAGGQLGCGRGGEPCLRRARGRQRGRKAAAGSVCLHARRTQGSVQALRAKRLLDRTSQRLHIKQRRRLNRLFSSKFLYVAFEILCPDSVFL